MLVLDETSVIDEAETVESDGWLLLSLARGSS